MSAVISECGRYRYRLERDCCPPFEGSKVYAYFGVNPSTADASIDDATVRKWRGFTLRNGGHRFIVGNVFCYRATDVKELRRQDDPFGPLSTEHFRAIVSDADILVPCWGSLSKMPRDLRGAAPQLLHWLIRSGKPVMCFGVTSCGQPKHPLMLGYDTPLIAWPS
ncbi:DUF1643 domain-containing protein [Pseudomonas aeruginosa]|uniref:DUF1643 domain-containing protein n=1 Tax=Pseudomonas aeruginosa TaxID=287 RepID=UPI0024988275|nr:DUF1643 domain-containing protein [Pseudomonas aeruginosa]MDI2516726.1 DUF1643 domain-containing protein [Pseudomonas aeruginosa]MDI2529065.1 DUF1643 domain-containing protein [Pseudomonas aeruginosa]